MAFICLAGAALSLSVGSTTLAQTLKFSHPNSLYSQTEINTAFSLATSGVQPWATGYQALQNRVAPALAYESQAPTAPQEYNSSDYEGLRNDGEAAFSCALAWAVDQSRTDCRDKALELLDRWPGTKLPPDDLETRWQFLFRVSGILLAADIMKSGTAYWARRALFEDWVRNYVVTYATSEYDYNTQENWPKRGQNHGSWALYTALLGAHITHDTETFNRYARELARFVEGAVDDGEVPCPYLDDMCRNDGSLGNERTRIETNENASDYGMSKAMAYTEISLSPLTAAMRVVRNVAGAKNNLFDDVPDEYDTTGATGRNFVRALQTFYHYNRNVSAWPFQSPDIMRSSGNYGALFSVVAPIYRSSEFDSYASTEAGPYNDKPGRRFMFAAPHATFLLSSDAQLIDRASPRLQTFEDGSGAFAIRNGDWNVEAEAGSPIGNHVFRQRAPTTSAATAYMGEAVWMDYGVRARINVEAFSGSPSAVGLFARYVDADNNYAFTWSATYGAFQIERRSAGATTVLSRVPFSFRTNAWYIFEVTATGEWLQFSVSGPDGTIIIPAVQDYTFFGGKVGLQAHRSTASFDSVCISRNGVLCAGSDKMLPPALIMSILSN